MGQTSILILSDAPKPIGYSGLGRIAGELAERMADMPEVRVAIYGTGGSYSRHLKYPFYPVTSINNYRVMDLPRVWEDFAGSERGILFTIWNHVWVDWIVDSELLMPGELKDFISNPPFQLWSYIPVDGVRADGTLPLKETLERISRPLAYTQFGSEAIGRTTGVISEWLPHGTDGNIFYPRNKERAREMFGLDKKKFIVGVVATNTPRKDWPLAFATVAELRRQGVDAALWAHTDIFQRGWNLPDLAKIHGIDQNWLCTLIHYTDEKMAWVYAACDATLGIGSGEGWGLPLSESLACGVPVITGDYAGATQFVPQSMLVPAVEFKGEIGAHSLLRPVFSPKDFAACVNHHTNGTRNTSLLDERYYWSNCWPKWREWILAGL